MSTLKVAAINNPSASSGGLAISASGNVTGAGLDLITTQSFSAVSSVSVNNCFSATYDNYLITSMVVCTNDTAFSFRLRAGGTDNSATQYNSIGYFVVAGTGPTRIEATNQTAARFGSTNTGGYINTMQIHGPFIAGVTRFVSDVGGNFQRSSWGGSHEVASAFDGITLIPSAGTITGSVSVYGYRK